MINENTSRKGSIRGFWLLTLAFTFLIGAGLPASPSAESGPGAVGHANPLACFCSISPSSAINTVGTSHTVTVTYTCNDGEGVSGRMVTLNISSGPNAGFSDSGQTNAGGQVSFTYSSNVQAGAGTDTIEATAQGAGSCSSATKTWIPPDSEGVENGPPEYNLQIDPVIKAACGCTDGSRTSFTDASCSNCKHIGSYPGIAQKTGGRTVYLHNGEFFHHVVDLEIPGRGFNWRFARSYRSGMKFNGPMGHGWEFNYNRRLFLLAGGPVLRMDGFARADAYLPKGNGAFTSPTGVYADLRNNGDGSLIEREPNGTKIRYSRPDTRGLALMTEVTDRQGNTMRFIYNVQRKLVRIIDTLGRPIDYRYDGDGRLIEVVDFTGRTLLFEYDSNGDLIASRSPVVTGTPTQNNFPQGKTTRYAYSTGFSDETLNHNLTAITAPNEVASGGQPRIRVEYETSPNSPNRDRALRQTIGGANSPASFANGQIQFRRDVRVPAGGTISYQYQFLGSANPNDFNAPVTETTATDRNGNRAEYQFNQLGNIVRIREFTNREIRPEDPEFYETRYEYNPDGEMTRMIHPEGNSVEYVYDAGNRLRFQRGNLMAEIRQADAKRGGDQPSLRTSYTYEPIYNQQRTVTDPRGNDPSYVPPNGGANRPERYRTESIFDYQEGINFAALARDLGVSEAEVRNLLQQAGIPMGLGDVNGDGRTDQIAGNVVKVIHPAVQLLPDSNMVRVEGGTRQLREELYVYNSFGQVLRKIDAEMNVEVREYYPENDPDGDGRDPTPGMTSGPFGYLKVVIRDAENNPLRNSRTDPEPARIRRQLFYDRAGNVIREVNGRGVATRYVVNQLNQIVRIIRAADVSEALENPEEPNFRNCPDPTLVECQAGMVAFRYITNRFYDYNNNLVRLEVENRDSNNRELAGSFIEFTTAHDILDHKIETTSEVSETPRQFLVTRYRYDRNENQVLEISPIAAAAGQPGNVVSQVYDERDLLFTETRGGLTPSFRNLAAHTDIPERNQIPNSPELSTYTRIYDLNRNLTELVDAADNTGDGQPEVTSYLHDGFDRWVSTIDAVGNQAFTNFDPVGNRVRESRFGPVSGPSPTDNQAATFTQPLTLSNIGQPLLNQAESKYDEGNRVFEIHNRLFDYQGQGVSYGRAPHLTDGPLGGADDGVVVTRYEYDRKNRQTFLIQDDLDTTETLYDGVDRVIEQIDPEQNRMKYAYDDKNNVVQVIQHEITPREDVRAGKAPDLKETFTTINVFDSLDRLIRATSNVGQTRRHSYDSRDNLILTSDAQQSSNAADLIADPLGLFPPETRDPGLATTINRSGNTMSYLYDGLNRRIAEVRSLRRDGQGNQPLDTGNPANSDGQVTLQTTWDANSRIIARVDDNGNATRYQYDNLNRGVRVVFADGTMNVHAYDADHNRLQTTDENRSVIARQYDGINRPINLNITRGSGVIGTTQQSFQYDGLSRLVRAVDNNEPGDSADDAVVTLAYDSLNRRLEEVQNGQAVSSRWAGDNSRLGLVYPNNRELAFTFDHLDRIDKIRDPGRRTSDSGLIADYDYVGPNRVLERSYANGARLTYLDDARQREIGYDGIKRVVTLRHLRADNSLIAGFGYTHSRQNDKLSEQRLDQPGVSERYTYDSLYRLVQSAPSSGSADTFQLDGVGNWMRRNQTANQVNAMNEYQQIGGVAQQYDANGNLTDDGRNRYEYDALNRLRRVTRKSDSATGAIYRYDALNRR
ncbi:MAG: hypothetical protein HY650_12565, partial [Acidobacteria bacterium]|nr:hypothetical protein [Acidobacteriota bacterium]